MNVALRRQRPRQREGGCFPGVAVDDWSRQSLVMRKNKATRIESCSQNGRAFLKALHHSREFSLDQFHSGQARAQKNRRV